MFTGGTNYGDQTGTVDIVIAKAVQPTITWATPAHITYGTVLDANQLNAAGSIAGSSLTYSPAAGTLLGAGPHTLTVTAETTTNYQEATQTVVLTVDPLYTARVRYTGAVFVSADTGSTTIPFAAQLSGGGDYRSATVLFVNAISGMEMATGTPDINGLVTVNSASFSIGAGQSYLIRMQLAGGNYDNTAQVFPSGTWTPDNMAAYAQVNVFSTLGYANYLQAAGLYTNNAATGSLKPIVPVSYGISAPAGISSTGTTAGMINMIIGCADGIYMLKAGIFSSITNTADSRVVTSTTAKLYRLTINTDDLTMLDSTTIASNVTVVATLNAGNQAQFNVFKAGGTSYWNDNGLVTILDDLTEINGRKGKNRFNPGS